MNRQSFAWQHDANQSAMGIAFIISLMLHFAIMHALPWLETIKTKPPLTIIAELETLAPPPPPPPAESKPIESPSKPEIVKKPEVVKIDKQPKPAPVLAARTEPSPQDYKVPDMPNPAIAPSEPAAPATPSSTPATSTSSAPATLSSNNVTTSNSTDEVSSDDAWDNYGQALYDMVGKNKNYPQIAVRRNWEGEAKVLAKFTLGKLVEVTLISSSGHKALDDEALAMVRKAANQLPVKGHLAQKTFTITVPVDFKLAEN